MALPALRRLRRPCRRSFAIFLCLKKRRGITTHFEVWDDFAAIRGKSVCLEEM
jgi:hypothetical protein